MAVSSSSMSGETDPEAATLPKSVIALAFDRVLNPIQPAASGLFLDVKHIVEQTQTTKKRKEEINVSEAAVKRSKADDTSPAGSASLPTNAVEMPPPPIPSKTPVRAEKREGTQGTEVRILVRLGRRAAHLASA